MKHYRALQPVFFISCIAFFPCWLFAKTSPIEPIATQSLVQLYHSLNEKPISSMPERIHAISAKLRGTPYMLGALGEGRNARYDQYPLFRLDAFDCETYVDTVLAIAFAQNEQTFKQCIRNIRYHNGTVNYLTRNHFASLDWNTNNQHQGYTKDITESFKNEEGKAVAQIAHAFIDKPSWYQHLPLKTIRLHTKNVTVKEDRLRELKQKGARLAAKTSAIPYLPLHALFDAKGNANWHLFKQIPDASIIEIVRPNWDLTDKIGTCLNVSHLGFALWHNNQLLFRQASSIHGRVIDVPLIDYLRDALQSPTIKGINVQIVLPKTTISNTLCKP